jgi:hypothetical protein
LSFPGVDSQPNPVVRRELDWRYGNLDAVRDLVRHARESSTALGMNMRQRARKIAKRLSC